MYKQLLLDCCSKNRSTRTVSPKDLLSIVHGTAQLLKDSNGDAIEHMDLHQESWLATPRCE